MKNKRLLATVLSALMLISCMSFTVSAKNAPSAAPKAFGGALVKAGSAASTPAKASAALAAEEAELAAEYYTVDELKAKYGSEYNVVYVRPAALQSGETQGTGATYDNPYLGIGSGDTGAFCANTANDAKVVFALTEDWTHGSADLQLNSSSSYTTGCDVIITSATKTPVKYHNANLQVLAFGRHGSVTFDNIIMSYNFTSNGQTATIWARGWDIKITDTVQLVKGSYTGAGSGLQINAGGNWETFTPADGDVVFDISGVSVNKISNGTSNNSRINGNIKYVWNSTGTVEDVYLAGHGNNGDDNVKTINGDITLEINKGLARNVYESNKAYINGNVTLNLNGGTLGNLRVYGLNTSSVMCGSWVVNWHGGDWWSLKNDDSTKNVTSKNRILVANTDNTYYSDSKLDSFKTKTVSDGDTTKLFTSVITYNGNKGKASVKFVEGSAYTLPEGVEHAYIGGSGPAFHKRTTPKLVLTRTDETVEKVYVGNTAYPFNSDDTVEVELSLNADQTLKSGEIAVVFGDERTVTFDANGGAWGEETIKEVASTFGGTISAPAENPTRDGFDFVGWYIGEDKVDFATYEVTKNVTITAKWKEYFAQVGDDKYETLAEAIEKAQAGAEVKLLKSTEGSGVVINKNITIDLGGNTYTFVAPAVGSAGTESNGFQILVGNTVTIKNGTLNVAEEAKDHFYILIQNYSNLTLENVTLDGTNLDKWSGTDGDSYVLSNNSGNVELKGNTNITANDEGELAFAFDVCKYASYSAPVVTVETTGTITGNIEVTEEIEDNLKVKSGTFTVDVTPYCEEGYVAEYDEEEGTYGVAKGTYTITFDTDGGSTVAPIEEEYGTVVEAPTAPTKDSDAQYSYTFSHWVDENDDEVTFPVTLKANMTLKAVWDSAAISDELKITISLPYKTGHTYANVGKLFYKEKDAAGEATEVTFDDIVSDKNAEVKTEFVVELDNVVEGKTYEIEIKKNGYVTYTTEVTIANGANTVDVELIGGDIKDTTDAFCGNGVVDFDDFVRVIRGFNKPEPVTTEYSDFAALVDLNEDGIITVSDLAIVKNGFASNEEE